MLVGMVRFSIRSLLARTALVALGLCAFVADPLGALTLMGIPLMRAGLCTPLGRPGLGAMAPEHVGGGSCLPSGFGAGQRRRVPAQEKTNQLTCKKAGMAI